MFKALMAALLAVLCGAAIANPTGNVLFRSSEILPAAKMTAAETNDVVMKFKGDPGTKKAGIVVINRDAIHSNTITLEVRGKTVTYVKTIGTEHSWGGKATQGFGGLTVGWDDTGAFYGSTFGAPFYEMGVEFKAIHGSNRAVYAELPAPTGMTGVESVLPRKAESQTLGESKVQPQALKRAKPLSLGSYPIRVMVILSDDAYSYMTASGHIAYGVDPNQMINTWLTTNLGYAFPNSVTGITWVPTRASGGSFSTGDAIFRNVLTTLPYDMQSNTGIKRARDGTTSDMVIAFTVPSVSSAATATSGGCCTGAGPSPQPGDMFAAVDVSKLGNSTLSAPIQVAHLVGHMWGMHHQSAGGTPNSLIGSTALDGAAVDTTDTPWAGAHGYWSERPYYACASTVQSLSPGIGGTAQANCANVAGTPPFIETNGADVCTNITISGSPPAGYGPITFTGAGGGYCNYQSMVGTTTHTASVQIVQYNNCFHTLMSAPVGQPLQQPGTGSSAFGSCNPVDLWAYTLSNTTAYYPTGTSGDPMGYSGADNLSQAIRLAPLLSGLGANVKMMAGVDVGGIVITALLSD